MSYKYHDMKTNFQTENLVCLNYHFNSGGKFLSNCLAVAENNLHQHRHIATRKMKDKWDQQTSFDVSFKIMQDKKFYEKHLEFGCAKLAGFVLQPTEELQERRTWDWFKELTHQTEYNFFMVVPYGVKNMVFKIAKNIILKNYEWILKDRGTEQEAELINCEDGLYFDMESIHDQKEFGKQVNILAEQLGSPAIDLQLLEKLRKVFLETYKIGFEPLWPA